jgi:hypothetical protein
MNVAVFSSTTVSSWRWWVVSFLLRSNHGGGGGYPLPRCKIVQSFLYNGYFSWRGRHPCIVAHSCVFPAKSPFLNYMGWRIGLSCYWACAIYFWALVQSTTPQARGSMRRSGDSGKTWENNCPLLRPICMVLTPKNKLLYSIDPHSNFLLFPLIL